ncbi:MAG: hypothetical protein L3J41_09180 [Melioribacteraceae bacterium]|nr:hypothetical protein [Melioribacteraceae bacterium]
MKKEIFKYDKWLVEYTTEDGARLDKLSYDNYDLLTTEPATFRAPSTDYGEYENRPVYGYDDCFPSVEACDYPGKEWKVQDHGELCWLNWEATAKKDRLMFTVKSKELPVTFKREMKFSSNGITWKFDVINGGDKPLPFQHVMHPLMPLDEVVDFKLPKFKSLYNGISDKIMHELNNPDAVKKYLLNQNIGSANMLFLQNIDNGEMSWTYKNNLHLKVLFSAEDFPSIGIWWNNSAYPNEDGCRRNECAFEPIPGLTSDLSEEYISGKCLTIEPGQLFSWEIKWLTENNYNE